MATTVLNIKSTIIIDSITIACENNNLGLIFKCEYISKLLYFICISFYLSIEKILGYILWIKFCCHLWQLHQFCCCQLATSNIMVAMVHQIVFKETLILKWTISFPIFIIRLGYQLIFYIRPEVGVGVSGFQYLKNVYYPEKYTTVYYTLIIYLINK